MSTVIGLTGPTGAGKSSACVAVKSLGIKVIDCDAVAREAVLAGTEGLTALTNAFGRDILAPDGSLNRKALAKAAFSSKEKTQLLDDTVLPHIVKLVKKKAGNDSVLLDAPTLFESGLGEVCTDTVAVLAEGSIRLDRIMRRDGITIEEARLRMNAGQPDGFYTERAGHILYNNGDSAEFLNEALRLFKDLFGGNFDE